MSMDYAFTQSENVAHSESKMNVAMRDVSRLIKKLQRYAMM